MKKIFIALLALALFTVIVFFSATSITRKSRPASAPIGENENPPTNSSGTFSPPERDSAVDRTQASFQPPLERASERVTKKPFGIYITPQNSPVQPERFRGYHTGTDFEIFPEEIDRDIPVRAVCSGPITRKNSASGYGSVLVQSCGLDGQPVTVIYGHLRIASVSKNTGENLSSGEEIGILGKAHSSETDGERKHLHLGIHWGKSANILGYVDSREKLTGWIDPCAFVCE